MAVVSIARRITRDIMVAFTVMVVPTALLITLGTPAPTTAATTGAAATATMVIMAAMAATVTMAVMAAATVAMVVMKATAMMAMAGKWP